MSTTEVDRSSDKTTGTLMWEAPLSREDDSPLSINDIDMYRIYWGATSGDYQNTIEVAGNTLYHEFDFATQPLPMYLVMTTVDLDGRESVYSAEVSYTQKIYNPKPPTGLAGGLLE